MVIIKASFKKVSELTEQEIGVRLLRSTRLALIMKHPDKRVSIDADYNALINKKYPKTIEQALALFKIEMSKPKPQQ